MLPLYNADNIALVDEIHLCRRAGFTDAELEDYIMQQRGGGSATSSPSGPSPRQLARVVGGLNAAAIELRAA